MNDSAQATSSNHRVFGRMMSSFNTPIGQSLPADDYPDHISQVDLLDSQKLDVFDQAISEAEKIGGSVIDQVWSQAVQASDSLNPPQAGHSTAKEKLMSSTGIDQTSPDSGTSIQYVEQEKVPEIPVEVESYLQKVEDNADSQPHEIVIADGTAEVAGANYPSRPVIVLPITQAMEDEGEKKSPKFSIKWLVEWSQKIIKIFAGKVVYRET